MTNNHYRTGGGNRSRRRSNQAVDRSSDRRATETQHVTYSDYNSFEQKLSGEVDWVQLVSCQQSLDLIWCPGTLQGLSSSSSYLADGFTKFSVECCGLSEHWLYYKDLHFLCKINSAYSSFAVSDNSLRLECARKVGKKLGVLSLVLWCASMSLNRTTKQTSHWRWSVWSWGGCSCWSRLASEWQRHVEPFQSLNIVYVLFCDLDECVGSCVDPHALCFLGVYL